jgi:mannose-6-phosphate isomerase-like protein (cupin superfamily)
MKNNYFNKEVIKKPWGFEYVALKNKNNLCLTYLYINPKQKTSLHCHYKKKTGFIIISGNASVQLGLYKNTIKKYEAPDKLMIRPGLFHQIKNIGKKPLEILELESPYDKFDLIRFEDYYGREKKRYETNSIKIDKKFNFNKKKNLKFLFEKCIIEIKEHKNFNNLLNSKMSSIHALLAGNIINNNKNKVLPIGDIIRTGTLKKIASKFKIKNKVKFLTLHKI